MSSSSEASFTFSDLFAGIGGFHAALDAAGGRWVFASEIDADAARVYDYNWLRPLRDKASSSEEAARYQVSGNIIPLTDPEVAVPHADVLAAGFPCQPFSKSGFQLGMEETRGTLFWNIARILADGRARPSVVLLENVRNLAGPRHAETFRTIVCTLRQLGFRTASRPAVFSPHLLPPALGGRPQVRERVFILAHYVGREAAEDPVNFDDPIVTPKTFETEWRKEDWDLRQDLPLETYESVRAVHGDTYDLEGAELKWIQEWDRLLTAVAQRLGPDERLPGFPIWLQHFGDFRTVEGAQGFIHRLERSQGPLPAWKRSHLIKNGAWFERFADLIEPRWQVISGFPLSRRKFEWQAGKAVPLAETLLQFRPSGIRAKKTDYAPALVAINQTSKIAIEADTPISDSSHESRYRRLTPREVARLQGLPESFEFRHAGVPSRSDGRQDDALSYKQAGNGVNVGAAYFCFRRYVQRHAEEIARTSPGLVRAVIEAPSSPDQGQ